MSAVASQSSSITTASLKRGQIDIEPDKVWKDGLRMRIEEGLQSMVDDAKKARDGEISKLRPNDTHREHLLREYDQAMTNIRDLAEEQFQIALERERQERRWLSGQAMLPQWDHALKSEQQEIMNRIKGVQKDGTSPVSASQFDIFSSSAYDSRPTAMHRATSPETPERQSTVQKLSVIEKPTDTPSSRLVENQTFERFVPSGDHTPKAEHKTVVGPPKEIQKESTTLSLASRPVVESPPTPGARLVDEYGAIPPHMSPKRRESIRKLSMRERPIDAPGSMSSEHQSRPSFERFTPPQWDHTPISMQHEIVDRPKDALKDGINLSPGSHPAMTPPAPGARVAEENRAALPADSPERRTTIRKNSVPERPLDFPAGRSMERSRPSIERFKPRSPPEAIPQVWKPSSKSPEEDNMPVRLPATTTRRPVNRKASFVSFEERDQPVYPPQAWLRSKASFTSDDRGYPSAPYHPSGSTSSRAGIDDRDRDLYYEYPRPYPTPPVPSRDYFPYYDARAEGPYQSEKRSATWRAAMMPESAPQSMRRLSESRPSYIRDASYTKYPYVPAEDEYPPQFDDFHEKYKYAPCSSTAIPISRPRKQSMNDDQDWRSWGLDPPVYRRGSRRDSRNDYFDYADRDHDYVRDERDYEYEARYRSTSYSSDVHLARRESHGPRSPPLSYCNDSLRNRESRDGADGNEKEDWRLRGEEDGRVKMEAGVPRRHSVDKLRRPEAEYEFFSGKDDSRRRKEEVTRDLEVKRLEEKVATEAKKLEQEATRQKEEALRQKEEARLLAEEAIRKQEEARKREEEVIRKEEEARRQGEEAKEKEEEILRKEEEIRKKAEEVLMKEREAKRKEQEAKKKEQEARKKEQEARRKEEDAKRKEEGARKKEEDAKRKENELKRKEEEARRKELEAKRKELEVTRKEEEAQRKEEEVKRKEEETKKREEEAQQKEEEARQKEEAIRQREEELKRREKELERRETEMSDRTEAERLQKQWDREEREKRAAEVQERLDHERRRHLDDTRSKEAESADPERRRQPGKNPERLEQERLQQEEFRRREEQIRRQKRQDSMSAESNWTPSSFPNHSSPAPSHSADRNTTSSSWTSWGASIKASSMATSQASSQLPSSTSSKPRSGSVNSTFSTSSHPPTPQEEAEWRRRQEEHFAKQQEQFRKEQERLAAARQQYQYEGRKPPTREDALATFETHNRQWVSMQEKAELRWRDFPWPMFRTPMSPDEIQVPLVRAYVESEYHPDVVKTHGPVLETARAAAKDKDKEIKSRLKDYMKKWHPDRFETAYLNKVIEGERQMVAKGAGSVARALGELLSSMTR